MHVVLLMHIDEKAHQAFTRADWAPLVAGYDALTARMRADGTYIYSAPLDDSDQGRLVRHTDGADTVTDGPFAETVEQIGGLYVFEVESWDQAVAYAGMVPDSPGLTVELRQVTHPPERS